MSKLDNDIALQSAALTMRRRYIHQRKRELRYGAMELCKKPSTLFTAALSGAVLARVLPSVLGSKQQPSAEGHHSTAGDNAKATARVVLFSLVSSMASTWVRKAFKPS